MKFCNFYFAPNKSRPRKIKTSQAFFTTETAFKYASTRRRVFTHASKNRNCFQTRSSPPALYSTTLLLLLHRTKNRRRANAAAVHSDIASNTTKRSKQFFNKKKHQKNQHLDRKRSRSRPAAGRRRWPRQNSSVKDAKNTKIFLTKIFLLAFRMSPRTIAATASLSRCLSSLVRCTRHQDSRITGSSPLAASAQPINFA